MTYRLLLLFLGGCLLARGQCAMCRAALQGNENLGMAKGVNDGITYLMLVPYVLAAIVGFLVYKAFRKRKPS